MSIKQVTVKKEEVKVTNTDLKKALYKEKPIATVTARSQDLTVYKADTSLGEVHFEVPSKEAIDENGRDIVGDEPEAQLLIRWMV